MVLNSLCIIGTCCVLEYSLGIMDLLCPKFTVNIDEIDYVFYKTRSETINLSTILKIKVLEQHKRLQFYLTNCSKLNK